jgi:ribosomal protein S18 acetylase RimI-like enzyme
MTTLPLIRIATENDLPAICALGEGVNAQHHVWAPRVFSAPGDPNRLREFFAQSVGKQDTTTLVAEESDQVVGFINVSLADEKSPLSQPRRMGRLGSVAVAEAARGRGIGGALVAAAESWAVGQGATEVVLNVWEENVAARRLYERLGYRTRAQSMCKEFRDSKA